MRGQLSIKVGSSVFWAVIALLSYAAVHVSVSNWHENDCNGAKTYKHRNWVESLLLKK